MDEEHPRGHAPPVPALHKQSVGVLASRAAFPRTALAFAIAWPQQSGGFVAELRFARHAKVAATR
jgi:hypothetical protein